MPLSKISRPSRAMSTRSNRALSRPVPSNTIYRFTRYCQVSDVVCPVGLFVARTFSFSLNSLPDFTEFQALYDQYRITKITLEFIPNANNANSINPYIVPFYTVIDYNDVIALANPNDALEYKTVKIHESGKFFAVSLVPRLATNVVDIAGNSLVNQMPLNTWVSTRFSAPLYLGVKLISEFNTPGNPAITYKVRIKYTLEFAQVI